MKSYKYTLEGLDCANCAKKIEDEIAKTKGYEDVIVNFSTSKISFESDNEISLEELNRLVKNIEPDARVTSLEDVKQKLIDLGYVRYDLIDGRGQFSVRGRNCRCINNREKRNKNRILGR